MELGPLVKIISHDLRGPLGNLKNIVALFKSGELEMEQAKMFMEHVEVGVDRSLKLLDDLIEWSHASGKSETQEEVDVNEIVHEVYDALSGQIEEKNLTFNFQEKEISSGYFSKSALKVILKNLLLNAVYFTESGGKIELSVKERSNYLFISISDTGIGVPDKMIDTIFEMGKDNRRLGTNEEKGTGIGLFICQDLVDRNNGKIWLAETKEGEGSTFKFRLKKFTG